MAVDAPLRVPNETGSRACDRALSAEWRQFHAGAYPANRRLLARNGIVRGEALAAALTERFQFNETNVVPRRTKARLVCEVYPHPALVSLFGLGRILKYKRGRGRSYEERWPEFERYRSLLRGLRKANPPLRRTKQFLKDTDVCRPARRGFAGLRGRSRRADLRLCRLIYVAARPAGRQAVWIAGGGSYSGAAADGVVMESGLGGLPWSRVFKQLVVTSRGCRHRKGTLTLSYPSSLTRPSQTLAGYLDKFPERPDPSRGFAATRALFGHLNQSTSVRPRRSSRVRFSKWLSSHRSWWPGGHKLLSIPSSFP